MATRAARSKSITCLSMAAILVSTAETNNVRIHTP